MSPECLPLFKFAGRLEFSIGQCVIQECHQNVYHGSSLLADLNFQSVSVLYKNVTRMSTSESELVINLIGEKMSEKESALRKAIYIQERLALMHSSTGLFISFPIYSHASCFLNLLKCFGVLGPNLFLFFYKVR